MSYSIKTKPIRIAIALILTLALIFGMAPLLPSGTASADDTVLTVEFRTGDTVTKTETYSADDLDDMANEDANTEKYLAWDGSKFVVLATNYSVSLNDIFSDANGGSVTYSNSDLVEITNGTDTKRFGVRGISLANNKNGYFYGNTTAKTGVGPGTVLNTAVLSLETGQADVTTTADTTNVNTWNDTALRFLGGLENRDDARYPRSWDKYLKDEDSISRYVSGVTKISLVKAGPMPSFKVYTQIGENGEKKLVKNFTREELNSLAHSDIRAFLSYASPNWLVHATNKYIPIDELIAAAGAVFNDDDSIIPRADDGFQATLSYEYIKANRNFYPGTASSPDPDNPTNVGAVLAMNYKGNGITISTGNAYTNVFGEGGVGGIDWTTSVNDNGRFLVGVSRENYFNLSAPGSRLVTSPTELTIVKDVADTLTDSNVTLAKTEYTVTGNQITPAVTVKFGGLTLKKDTDYKVSYGANKDEGQGTVTVEGIGNFTGSVNKTFTIKAVSTAEPKITIEKIADQTYNGKAKTPKLTVKADGKALALGTDYTAKYSNNKNIGKATVTVTTKAGKDYTATFKINPKATAGFKLKALKKSFKASWKKDSKATGYEIQYSTDKKISKSIKKYAAKKNSTVTKTFKSLKSKKTYYAKIRTYKTVSGVKYYSAWSKPIKVKTK